jgi:hypothetical protein
MGGAKQVGLAVICWAVLGAVGCSSPQANEQPAPPESKPVAAPYGATGSTLISDLSDEQRDEFCGHAGAFLLSSGAWDSVTDTFARVTGVHAAFVADPKPTTDAEARAVCQEAYDEAAKLGSGDPKQNCAAAKPSCGATIDEYDACLAVEPEFRAAQAASLPTCDELTLDYLQSGMHQWPERPAACTTVEKKCAP